MRYEYVTLQRFGMYKRKYVDCRGKICYAENEDDDIFCGHWIVVYGNGDGTLKEARIEG